MLTFLSKSELIKAQLVCKLWYHETVPLVMETCLTDLGKLIKQCNFMLADTLYNKNKRNSKILKNLKPPTVEMF